ncbi:hypothetical protein NPIL_654371 [Nephila pilipes]|uniref:Uncharacterized protein n=1 Tax=Nephila pilipes TaxID=299642 RepID=A0A8X6TFH1_NEPPI|nr:hypothetical protein NPIL_654371 [Nephila pilipes]
MLSDDSDVSSKETLDWKKNVFARTSYNDSKIQYGLKRALFSSIEFEHSRIDPSDLSTITTLLIQGFESRTFSIIPVFSRLFNSSWRHFLNDMGIL